MGHHHHHHHKILHVVNEKKPLLKSVVVENPPTLTSISPPTTKQINGFEEKDSTICCLFCKVLLFMCFLTIVIVFIALITH
jgi:hypothetical protein